MVQNPLTYIYEVYKERSFSQAAKNLFVSQPALSACIKKVEQEIGMQLFDRSTLPVTLTEAGELYVQAILKIRAIENELKTQLNELSNLERGHLAIGGANFFSAYMLPPVIRAFSNLYPGVEIEITEADTNTLYNEALKDDINLILDGGTCDNQLFERALLYHEHLLFAVPKQNPLNEAFADCALTYNDIINNRHLQPDRKTIPIELFSQQKLILLKRGHDMHMRSITICENAGFTPRNVVYVNQLSTASSMARQGLGCTFVTDSLIRFTPLNTYALRFYPIKDSIASREVFVAWHRKGIRSKVMYRFVEMAQDVYADLQRLDYTKE